MLVTVYHYQFPLMGEPATPVRLFHPSTTSTPAQTVSGAQRTSYTPTSPTFLEEDTPVSFESSREDLSENNKVEQFIRDAWL